MSFYPVETINGGEKAKSHKRENILVQLCAWRAVFPHKIYRLRDIFLCMITVPMGSGNQIYIDTPFI